jgi:hypothetical protein
MSRHIGQPVPVEEGPRHTPRAFTYKGTRRAVRVIGRWHLQDRWWDEARRSNRYYYRVQSRDLQVWELYLDVAQRPPLWVLDVILD